MSDRSLIVLSPDLQLSFYNQLKIISEQYLSLALTDTILKMDIERVDGELLKFVSKNIIRKVAGWGLRGERIFPVPCILEANPFLLGYYRLLFGFSQKQFYQSNIFGKFKGLEEKGIISTSCSDDILWLCKCLIKTGECFVSGISNCSDDIIHDLQLLTIGPQLRGGRNKTLGKVATEAVFTLIQRIVSPYIRNADPKNIEIMNDSGRKITIAFSSDPDISISEQALTGQHPLVSIEIKGGTDYSNIHNRLGEAEKSHQNAKSSGFHQFWTILNIDIDDSISYQESPTTTYFFPLHRIKEEGSKEYIRFREILFLTLGIH